MTGRSTVVDLAGRPAAVYRLYGKNSRLLYVGCTVRPRERVAASARYIVWQSHRPLTAVKVEHYQTFEQAATVEAWAIENEAPVFNRQPGRVLAPLESCAAVRVEWLNGDLVPVVAPSLVELTAAAADLARAQRRYECALDRLDAGNVLASLEAS